MNVLKNIILSVSVIITYIFAAGISCSSNIVSPSENQPSTHPSAHILLYSDIGYADEGQYLATKAMARRHAEFPFNFAISAGDNIQLKPVLSGPASILWGADVMEETFERPFAALIRDGVCFYAAFGNHDHQGLRHSMEINYSNKINARTRGVGGFICPASDYAVRRNGVKIIFLDVATAFSSLSWSEERAEFVRRELSSRDEKWQILVLHYPLWSSGEHGKDKILSDLRKVILPVLDEYPVDFVISGHDHHGELFKYQGMIETRIAIVGNTARPHYLPCEPEIPSIFRTNTRGFAEINIQNDRAELSFRSFDGTIMFKDIIQK